MAVPQVSPEVRLEHESIGQRLALARQLADASGELVMRYFRGTSLQEVTKGDGSPVTIADREAELLMRREIERVFPDDAVIGEEHGERPGTSGYRWILDPVDGTTSFVHGVPLFGTLIGVEFGGKSVVGVLNCPAVGERVYAATGQGAWYEQRQGRAVVADRAPARVSATDTLARATWSTTSLDYWVKMDVGPLYPKLQARTHTTRGWSDCYAFLLVATGRIDAAVEPAVKIWDVAAIQPIVEEAGGRYSDWQGVASLRTGHCVVSNAALHQELVEFLSPAIRR
ncbi:MAG: inositol monophosphatase family protein [Planctomycetota bacterium]|nr:inositol monophosphatase family protein [Planctomycetota bacterium]